MKFSLRYDTIVTTFRIIVAMACSWLTAVTHVVIRIVSPEIVGSIKLGHLFAAISLLEIIYCHGSVYFVCRLHLIQIKSVQHPQEITEKFLEEKKAWKTTGIVICGVYGCYMLGFLSALLAIILPANKGILDTLLPDTLVVSFYILNSLLNPVIYCWRSTALRKAMTQLFKKSR